MGPKYPLTSKIKPVNTMYPGRILFAIQRAQQKNLIVFNIMGLKKNVRFFCHTLY
jgi:hypothetical protein